MAELFLSGQVHYVCPSGELTFLSIMYYSIYLYIYKILTILLYLLTTHFIRWTDCSKVDRSTTHVLQVG